MYRETVDPGTQRTVRTLSALSERLQASSVNVLILSDGSLMLFYTSENVNLDQ